MTIHLFKTIENGLPSYGTADDENLIPEGATLFPDQASYEADLDATRNPPPTFDQRKAAKIADLTASCAAAIMGGFTSSALGAAHSYPSTMADQQNMIASVTASLLPGLPAGWTTPFWCADASGTWAFTSHTVTQIQEAGQDGKAMVLAAQAKLEGLRQQVGAASTVGVLTAIVWG